MNPSFRTCWPDSIFASAMAQPAATVPVPRLIPVFPQEITLIILEHLELIDLVTLFFRNPTWTELFDSDNTMRQRMFRLPREKTTRHADDSEQATWIQEQWTQMQAKMKPIETSADNDRMGPSGRRYGGLLIATI